VLGRERTRVARVEGFEVGRSRGHKSANRCIAMISPFARSAY
jgi:hypothetical protein